ncbi:MAG: metal-sulfur cluster assembly factor [Planctomycetota bacterium]|nr:metal-sulfur cluster assembly factor [Planctomycetota bacterium]
MASDDPRADDNLEPNETSESELDAPAESDPGPGDQNPENMESGNDSMGEEDPATEPAQPDNLQQGVGDDVNLGGAISEDRVREELKQVIDPELFVNIVDLGLIYEVTLEQTEEGPTNVSIDMTLTSPMCPAGPQLIGNSKQVLEALEETGEIEVRIVLDPAWSPDRMTDDARDQLGIF